MENEVKETKEINEVHAEAAAAAAEEKAVSKKFAALKDFMLKVNVGGMQFLEADENNKILRSNLLIEGQRLPLFVVINNTVYSYIQVHLTTVTPEKAEKCYSWLNTLNNNFNMLKYHIAANGNVVVTCSIPSGNDKFDPALVVALIDQVKLHLEKVFPELMQKIWQK